MFLLNEKCTYIFYVIVSTRRKLTKQENKRGIFEEMKIGAMGRESDQVMNTETCPDATKHTWDKL